MKITLIGMENYLNSKTLNSSLIHDSLFNDIVLPESPLLEKTVLVDTILLDCGEFGTLYSDPYFMKAAVSNFFLKWNRTFVKWCNALETEYLPLENYNRTEIEEYENNEQLIRTTHIGEHKTTEKVGKLKTTNDAGSTKLTNSDGTRTTNSTAGKLKTTNDAGSTKLTNSDGTKTTNVTAGSTNTTVTNPDSTTKTDSFAGFSDSYSNIESGTISSFKVGTGKDGTYNQTTSTEQTTPTVETVTHTGAESVSTQTKAGESITEQLEPNETTYGHAVDANDVETVIAKPKTIVARGNIGVTTSQQMLKAELDLQMYNLYKQICDLFMTELLIPVYL